MCYGYVKFMFSDVLLYSIIRDLFGKYLKIGNREIVFKFVNL